MMHVASRCSPVGRHLDYYQECTYLERWLEDELKDGQLVALTSAATDGILVTTAVIKKLDLDKVKPLGATERGLDTAGIRDSIKFEKERGNF